MAWELTGNIKGDPGVVSDEILGDLFWASRRQSEPDPELTLTLGAAETVLTLAQRTALGLGFFPDGTAQFRYQAGVGFIGQASNGANTAVWGAADPAAAFVDSVYAAAVVMGNTPVGTNYGSGGPVLAGVTAVSESYFIAHMERTIFGSQHYTHLALASLNASLAANYLWPVVTANIPDDDPVFATYPNLDMGSGPTAAPGDGYTYVFYKDRMAGAPSSQHMSMARCLISDIEAWQDSGPIPQYKKWNGPENRWSEPGIGGEAVDLFDDVNGYLAWMDVIWLEQAQRWACIYSYDNYNTGAASDYSLGIKFCADLANPVWTEHQDLIPSDLSNDEKAFVTVSAPFVADESYDQRFVPGNTFHVFRTIAPTIEDGNRWDDAYVERRTVTISTVSDIIAANPAELGVSTNNGETTLTLEATMARQADLVITNYNVAVVAALMALKLLSINAQTGTTYTPVVTDADTKMVTLSNAGSITVTLPQDSAVNIPIGAQINFLWLGVGAPTFAAGAGATVNKPASKSLTMAERYTLITAIKTAANTWLLVGALA